MSDPYTGVRRRLEAGEIVDPSMALVPAGQKELRYAAAVVSSPRKTPDREAGRSPESSAAAK